MVVDWESLCDVVGIFVVFGVGVDQDQIIVVVVGSVVVVMQDVGVGVGFDNVVVCGLGIVGVELVFQVGLQFVFVDVWLCYLYCDVMCLYIDVCCVLY